jgi:sulfatase modifying factor 1
MMMAAVDDTDWLARAPWPFPPPWACAWGDDRYGLWADFAVQPGDVVQRMRWVESGDFMMGSPDGELKRYDDEGPQHQVRISTGFWLADTACTQALWLAVMGDNPSHFKGAGEDSLQLPVENVNWLMVQDFLRKLTALLPDGLFTLPTEAEWEYACRADGLTPFHFGATIHTDQANYYGDAYGDGQKGEWRQRTVPVKELAVNDWGLYQMHGNVWEWCHDPLRQFTSDAVLDPGLAEVMQSQATDQIVGGAARALRGGSWSYGAQLARSACRFVFAPGSRDFFAGFRLACRSSSQASPGGAGGG